MLSKVLKNDFFKSTPINIDRYIPLYINPKFIINNAVTFQIKKSINTYDLDALVDAEGGKILWWLLKGVNCDGEKTLESIERSLHYTDNKYIRMWLEKHWEFIDNMSDKIGATDLYEMYEEYCKSNNRSCISMRGFCLEMGQYLNKKRTSSGIFYLGLKQKNV